MTPRQTRQRILIVDDDPANLQLLGAALREDYDVVVAKSGEQALKRLEQGPVDLALLDVVMPGIDGYEVLRRMKADPRYAQIPVIFVSAVNEATDTAHGRELGAVDYITKPLNLPTVQARVRTHLAPPNGVGQAD